jgi:hypothetical protein
MYFNPTTALIGRVQSAPPAELKLILHGVKFNPAVALNLMLCGITSIPPAALKVTSHGVKFNPAVALNLIPCGITPSPQAGFIKCYRGVARGINTNPT